MISEVNKILQGDCLDELKNIPSDSIDSIVTDPPYELGFMGKSWDNTGIANNKEMWAECLRVLKPGGHLLAFSGTRTYHRMACAIEDAGFEVRDMIEWCYGSGFPKSLNIGKAVDKLQGNEREQLGDMKPAGFKTAASGYKDNKAWSGKVTKGTTEWEGWGTALKPAHEPICMARKPLAESTVALNVLKYGTGGINIDVSRVSTDAYKDDDSNESIVPSHKLSELRGKLYTLLSSCVADKTDFPPFPNDGEYALRWKELSDFLCGCQFCYDLYDVLLPLFQEGDPVSFQQLHDVQGGISRLHKEPSNNHEVCIFRPSTKDVLSQLKSYSNDTKLHIQSQGRFPANLLHDNSEEVRECFPDSKAGSYKGEGSKSGGIWSESTGKPAGMEYGDSGNASRFFKSIIYQAKASKSERNKGLDSIVLVDILRVWNENNTTKEEKLIRLMVTGISPQKVIAESGVQLKNANEWNTCLFGKHLMEKYQEDIKSIIKTETNSITISQTLNWLIHLLTNEYTVGANLEMENGGNLVANVENSNTLTITINEAMALALGVKDVVSGMQLKISVKEGNNIHSTVKPISLMEYLIKMVTPKGGVVLDPFAGSGSTLVAAKQNGFNYIGIEKEPEYINIINARLQ